MVPLHGDASDIVSLRMVEIDLYRLNRFPRFLSENRHRGDGQSEKAKKAIYFHRIRFHLIKLQIYASYLTFPYLRFLWEYSSRAARNSSRLKSGHRVSTKTNSE